MSAVLDYLPRATPSVTRSGTAGTSFSSGSSLYTFRRCSCSPCSAGTRRPSTAETLALPLACLIIGHLLRSRRLAAAFVTLGLIYCSAALVGFSNGAIEAHFHFFIMIGFIALYQDWVPFLLDILFTVLSHGIGSSFVPDLMFNHPSAQQHPWEWSLIHGVAVLAACVGVVVFWKNTEEEQQRSLTLTQQLAAAEIGRRRFTSELLVNLARRNQNLLYRQLELLNDLEDKERDADALADLFRLDHLATRIRRNAESLLVLSGEESPRTWREPVQLVDVIRAAIAEIEDLDRVDDAIDETLAVSGRSVADLTHLFAELLENAVHFSPPGVTVVVRSRPVPSSAGTHVVTIEDWGVGMTPGELAEANEILRAPAGGRPLGLATARGACGGAARAPVRDQRRADTDPGGGVTAVAMLPPAVFERAGELVGAAVAGRSGAPDPVGGFESRPDGAGFGIDFGPADGSRPVDGRGRPAALNGSAAGGLATTPARSAAPAMRPGPADPPAFPTDPTGRVVGPLPRRDPSDSLPRRGPGDPGDPGPRLPESGTPTPSDEPRPGTEPAPRPTAPRPHDATTTPPGARSPAHQRRPDVRRPAHRRPGARSPAHRRRPDVRRPAHRRPGARSPAHRRRPDVRRPAHRRPGARSPAHQRRPGARRPAHHRSGPGARSPTHHQRSVGRGERGRRGQGRPERGRGRRRLAGGGPWSGRRWGGQWSRGHPAAGAVPRPDRGRRRRYPARTGLHRRELVELVDPGDPAGPEPAARRPVPGSDPYPDPDPYQDPDPYRDPHQEPEPNGSTPDQVPLPEPRPPADDSPQLRRRVPQANLAAGLRRDAELQPPEDPVVRDPLAARNALSRFQAAQRAARDAVEGERGDGGPA